MELTGRQLWTDWQQQEETDRPRLPPVPPADLGGASALINISLAVIELFVFIAFLQQLHSLNVFYALPSFSTCSLSNRVVHNKMAFYTRAKEAFYHIVLKYFQSGSIQLLEKAIPLPRLSQKIRIPFPLTVFLRYVLVDFSKASCSFSDYLTSIFPENFWISWFLLEFICHMAWAPKGRQGRSQKAQRASS